MPSKTRREIGHELADGRDRSVGNVDRYSEAEGIVFFEGLRRAADISRLSSRAQRAMLDFVGLGLCRHALETSPYPQRVDSR